MIYSEFVYFISSRIHNTKYKNVESAKKFIPGITKLIVHCGETK